MAADVVAFWGILFPESVLHTPWLLALAGFVGVNTVVYVTLAVAKALPRVYVGDWMPRRYARGETRSIYPDGPR